jgi:hypothetical protein
MNAREERALARIRSAGSQLRSRLRLKDAPPMYEHFLAKLQASIAQLRELEFEQFKVMPQHVAEGQNTAYLRTRLRHDYMIPLTRIGKGLFSFAPGVQKALKVPHARASHRELVTTAEVMLKAVQGQRAFLVKAGFPKTFLTEFREVTRELKRIATTSSARQAKFTQVTGALREELASANEILRILDGLVLRRADQDPHFARMWKDVLRTPKPLGRPRTKKRKLSPNEPTARGPREQPPTP